MLEEHFFTKTAESFAPIESIDRNTGLGHSAHLMNGDCVSLRIA